MKLEKDRVRNRIREYEILHKLSHVFGLDRGFLKMMRAQVREHPEMEFLEALKRDGYGTLPGYLYIEHEPLHTVRQWGGDTILKMPQYTRLVDRLKAHGDIMTIFPVCRDTDHVITTCGFEMEGFSSSMTVAGRQMHITDITTFERYYRT